MNNISAAIVIKVENLDLCKSFYRDVLGLGAPVIDSSFWTEFRLSEFSSLILEKAEWDILQSNDIPRFAWVLRSENPAAILERLELYGYSPESNLSDKIGISVSIFKDPEGNPFYIVENAQTSDSKLKESAIK